jgi:hypothetical protein
VIYLTGSYKNKELFMFQVFGIKIKDSSFSEYKTTVEGSTVYVQLLKDENGLDSVHDMHMNMANGIIFLKENDQKIKTNKKVLFVLMNGKSEIESDENLLVSSIVDNSFEESRKGVDDLVKLIKK